MGGAGMGEWMVAFGVSVFIHHRDTEIFSFATEST